MGTAPIDPSRIESGDSGRCGLRIAADRGCETRIQGDRGLSETIGPAGQPGECLWETAIKS
jgi:hypothetical protein